MLFTQVLNAGVSDIYPNHLQKKIRISNSIGLILLLGVATPFTLISWIHFPDLIIVPVLGMIVCSGGILLNALGSVHVGRIIISLLPMMLAAAYQIGLTAAGEPLVLGLHMIELSFSLTAFLVFDLREKGFLFPLILINLLIIITSEYTTGWWELPIDTAIIREGYVGVIAVMTSILVTFASVFTLVQQNLLSERETTQLLQASKEDARKREQSEQELKDYVEQLKIAQEEEKQRQWISEGLTQVNSMLRDHDDLQVMSDRLIAHIVRYIKANQGGLFIVGEENGTPCIRLQACYAYERKKYIEKTIAIGQGLVGQAYLEREYIYMTELPEKYINITSGLGKTPPRSLLIMPLIINEEVEGILEIASFQEFKDHEIKFIQTLGENIAATLKSSKVSRQTNILLAESQQQAEEMRAQEEEMRQNMEELQATQEQSDRLKAELEENQRLLQVKLKELEATQRESEEIRLVEKQRAEDQIKARTEMMEKAVAKFKQTEQQLRQEITELSKLQS